MTSMKFPAADDVYSFVAGTRIDLDRLAELRAASAERREQAELALRTALAEHPGDERQAQQAATTLLAEYWAVEQFKYVDDPAAGQKAIKRCGSGPGRRASTPRRWPLRPASRSRPRQQASTPSLR